MEQKGENELKGRKCEIMGRRGEGWIGATRKRWRKIKKGRKGEKGKKGRRRKKGEEKEEKMSGMGRTG